MFYPSPKYSRSNCWSQLTAAILAFTGLICVEVVSSLNNDSYLYTGKFSMKDPLNSLSSMRDPFQNGVRLGYNIGFKIGYNEERNATLESNKLISSSNLTAKPDLLTTQYIGRAAFRKATTAAAKKAFNIAVREGYMAALKVSYRAGLKIPAEGGSKMAALKCVSVAEMTGMEVGGSSAFEFLLNKDVGTAERDFYIKLGKDKGSYAGMIIGERIGAYVGKKAAEEAYKRAITRGAKLERAKFYLEEFEAGARMGFDYGLEIGKQVAASPKLKSTAPRRLRLPKPFSSKKKGSYALNQKLEKQLRPALTGKKLAELEKSRKHIPVEGILSGQYTVLRETKNLWMLKQNSTKTYKVSVKAKGYVINDVVYLNLKGVVDKKARVHGSITTRDVFKDKY